MKRRIRKKKRFCINGHNTFIYGRDKANGECKKCKKIRAKKFRQKIKEGHISKPRKQFCLQGHDVSVVGRNKWNGCCLECARLWSKRYRDKHKRLVRKRGRKSYHRHRLEYIKIARTYQAKHRDQIRIREQKWRRDNIKRIRKTKKRWNKKKIRIQACKRSAFRRKTDLQYKLRVYLRSRLGLAIKNKQKTGSAVRDLGCSIEFFIKYIEKKFKRGMTWANWGKIWDLDHKIALFKFDLTDRKQFLKAVNYKNMRPLSLPDHVKKTAKEVKEFWKNR
jgi:hypothetical protein